MRTKKNKVPARTLRQSFYLPRSNQKNNDNGSDAGGSRPGTPSSIIRSNTPQPVKPGPGRPRLNKTNSKSLDFKQRAKELAEKSRTKISKKSIASKYRDYVVCSDEEDYTYSDSNDDLKNNSDISDVPSDYSEIPSETAFQGSFVKEAHPVCPAPSDLQFIYSPLDLPPGSNDLIIDNQYVLQSLAIYEVLRHFSQPLRLTRFLYEDFLASLLCNEQCTLLAEIHISLLKVIIREEESLNTTWVPNDWRGSLELCNYFLDYMIWPELLRMYFDSSPEFAFVKNHLTSDYPFTSLDHKLGVLTFLTDIFLQTSFVRNDLASDGVIPYDENCRECQKPGEVLCCDSCPAVYHLQCVDPPFEDVPESHWVCRVCIANQIDGVSCVSDSEGDGFMWRQEPLGQDRFRRKYWFIARRIFVESMDGTVTYYSTPVQLKALESVLDREEHESLLCNSIDEVRHEIVRQMRITEKFTNNAKGSRVCALEFCDDYLLNNDEPMNVENIKSSADKLSPSVNNNIDCDLPSQDVSDVHRTRSRDPNYIPNSGWKSDYVYEAGDMMPSKSMKKESEVDILIGEMKQTLKQVKKENIGLEMTDNLFRLGQEEKYKYYVNHFSVDALATPKQLVSEEFKKQQQLNSKYSIENSFEWDGTVDSNKLATITTLRLTLCQVENRIPSIFLHPRWGDIRVRWTRGVQKCQTPKALSLALAILESCIKPVSFVPSWHENLGHINLIRQTQLQKEQDDKEKKDTKNRYLDSGACNIDQLVKYTLGHVKHTVWKMKGEEYRVYGNGGWVWKSSTFHHGRFKMPFSRKKAVDNADMDDSSNSSKSYIVDGLVDVSESLIKHDKYAMINGKCKLDTLLDKRKKFDLTLAAKRKAKQLVNLQHKCFKPLIKLQCYSSTCVAGNDGGTSCYSPLCQSEDCNYESDVEIDVLGRTQGNECEFSDDKFDDVQTTSKPISLNKRPQAIAISRRPVPKNHKFLSFSGVRSLFVLPTTELRKMARKSGYYETEGYSYSSKPVWHWIYSAPRPWMKTAWKWRVVNADSLSACALCIRILFVCIRWDELSKKPPQNDSGLWISTDEIEETVTTRQILDKRDVPPDCLRSEYLVEIVIQPTSMPEKIPVSSRAQSRRTGLRQRKPDYLDDRITETQISTNWVREENLEPWEIRSYGDRLEREEYLRKKKEELPRPVSREVLPKRMMIPKIEAPSVKVKTPDFRKEQKPQRNASIEQYKTISTSSTTKPIILHHTTPNQKGIRVVTSLNSSNSDMSITGRGTPKINQATKITQSSSQITQSKFVQIIDKQGNVRNLLVHSPATSETNSVGRTQINQLPVSQSIVSQHRGIKVEPSPKKLILATPPVGTQTAKSSQENIAKSVYVQPVQTQAAVTKTQQIVQLPNGIRIPVPEGCTVVQQGNQVVIAGKNASQIQSLLNQQQTKATTVPSSQPALLRAPSQPSSNTLKSLSAIPPDQLLQALINKKLPADRISTLLQQIQAYKKQNQQDSIDMPNAGTDNLKQMGENVVTPQPKAVEINLEKQSTPLTLQSVLDNKTKKASDEKVKLMRDKETSHRLSICKAVMRAMLDKVEKEQKQHVKRLFREQARLSQEKQNFKLVQSKLSHMLIKNKEALKKDITRKRMYMEKQLVSTIEEEIYGISTPDIVKPPKIHNNLPISSENHRVPEKVFDESEPIPPVAKKRKTTPKRKRQSSESSPEMLPVVLDTKKSSKTHCICNTPYDSTKFYVGCDLCMGWFHGRCVGLPESKARFHDSFTCPDCMKKQSADYELFCLCRKPYDQSQFYIGCDFCNDWFHGRCVGILEKEAKFIDSYVCPRCHGKQCGFSSGEQNITMKPLSLHDYEELAKVMKSLRNHKMSWPFMHPVDASEVPDYLDVVKNPLDLSIVEQHVLSKSYMTLKDFIVDISTIFDNCRIYNAPKTNFFVCAENLESFFISKLRKLKENMKRMSQR